MKPQPVLNPWWVDVLIVGTVIGVVVLIGYGVWELLRWLV